jgi:hypothetical protein
MRTMLFTVIGLIACGPTLGDSASDGGGSGDASGAGSGGSDTTVGTEASTAAGDDSNTGNSMTESSESDQSVECLSTELSECSDAVGCMTVSGSEATPTEEPGQYECSDLGSPFACTEVADCELFSGILCEGGERLGARWVIEECIPPGWAPCPDDAACAPPNSLPCQTIEPFECSDVAGCVPVSGSEATPTEEPGQYECSDLGSPFACMEVADCELFSGILCEGGERLGAQWVIEECIPPGWAPCPDEAACIARSTSSGA